jgi:hypothetical protein
LLPVGLESRSHVACDGRGGVAQISKRLCVTESGEVQITKRKLKNPIFC